MTNPNTFLVPTCGNTFNQLGPYNNYLKSAFETQMTNNLSTNVPATCPTCNKDLKVLGYTSDLYECTQCMSLDKNTTTTPRTPTNFAKSWGCASCYNVVAPIAYYQNKQNSAYNPESTPYIPTSTDITNYLNNTNNYKTNVDSAWSNATQLNKGDVVQKYCITRQNFTMETPPPEDCKFEWGPWDQCNSITGKQWRTAKISAPAKNGGAQCPSPQSQNCNDCESTCTDYGVCDPTTNEQKKTCQIIKNPVGSGVLQCPLTEEKRTCVTETGGRGEMGLSVLYIVLIVVGGVVLLCATIYRLYSWRKSSRHEHLNNMYSHSYKRDLDKWNNFFPTWQEIKKNIFERTIGRPKKRDNIKKPPKPPVEE
jgi:hypothetical protein